MCRLAYIPAKVKVNRKQLGSFFYQLEKSFGGDGNGYAAISPDGTIAINKGVKLTCKQIAKEAAELNRMGWAIYFHTRKISIGWSSDEQCHPFEIDGPEFQGTLCHNGTWSEGGTLAKYLGTGSDTATFAYLIGQLGLEELEKRRLIPSSGIFLLHGAKSKDQAINKVLNLGGSLEYCPHTGVWASEFFRDWPHYNDTYRVAMGRHMLDKAAPKSVIVNSNYYTSTNKSYGYYPPSNRNVTIYDYDDSDKLDDYWKSKGYADALDEVETETDELAFDDSSDWGDRYYYHN